MMILLPDFLELKMLYALAVAEQEDTFIWMGHEWLVSYAKYLIEYLQPRFDEISGQ